MKKHLQNLRNEQGLTLVELLAVVVIIAIIAVIAFVMIGQVIENSKKDTHISNAIQIIESAKLYAITEDEKIDSSFEVKVEDLQTTGHFETNVRDAWSKEIITPKETDLVSVDSDGDLIVTFQAEDPNNCHIKGVKEQVLLKKSDRDAICTATP